MHTKTASAVLKPLADAVSALIVIISESEISGTPTPNLTQLSKAVDLQIKNLSNVAKRIIEQPSIDSQIKETMTAACERVLNASGTLISSTNELVANPVSSIGRQDLLEAIKGILEGTTRILDVFDDSEILKVIKVSESIREILKKFEALDRTPAGHDAYLHLLKQFSQTIVLCLQVSTKRVKEILSEQLAADLSDSIDCASKEAGLFVVGAKLALNWPTSAEALQVQNTSMKRLTNELLRIENIIKSKGEDEEEKRESVAVAHQNDDLVKALQALSLDSMSKQWKASAETSRENIAAVITAAKNKINHKHEIMESLSHPDVLAFPEKAQEHFTLLFNAFKDLIDDATLDLNEDKFDQDSKEIIKAIEETISALDSNRTLGVVGELISILGDLSDISNPQTAVGAVNEAVNNNEPGDLGVAVGVFEKRTQKMAKLIEYVLQNMPIDHLSRPMITTLFNRTLNSLPGVINASALFQKFPDELAGNHLQNHLLIYSDAVRELQKKVISYEHVFKTDELLIAGRSLFELHIQKLQEALFRNDHLNSTSEINQSTIAATQLLSIIEREKDNTEDSVYREKLEKELILIRAAVSQVTSKSNDLLVHIGHIPSSEMDEMKKIVSALTNGLFKASQVIQAYKGVTHAPIVVPVAKFWTPPEQSTPTVTAKSIASPHVVSEIPVIAPKVTEAVSEVKSSEAEATPVSATIEPPPLPALTEEEKKEIIAEAEKHQDNELRGLSSAIKDVVIIMDIAPQPLSEKEAEADPMRAAGQELKVEASHWVAESNIIVTTVNKIGEMFLLLSNYHKELYLRTQAQAKKSFIQTAQEILLETGKLIKAVEPLIKSCADKRLVGQITQTTARTSTLAQTLKVIAAVKASSPRDNDRGVQLISNARNLMQSVKMILRDAISCSLRLKIDSPPDLVHFKKVIYAKRGSIKNA